tara:strand:+ start:210 stop:593 length:384 start_codon:yes stop_codon:yes gene_type:complete
MNKEHYYTTKTDKQRISDLQRHIMKMEDTINKQSDEIVRLTIKSDKDDEMIEQSYEIIDVSFEDNGRIVPGYKQKEQSTNKILFREQTPMYMLQTLEECHTKLKSYTLGKETELETELRNVIKFLQQ